MAHSFTGTLVPCSSVWPARPKKLLTIHISTVDVDMEFSVPYKTTGKEVFEKAANTIGLRETWYFGLKNNSNGGKSDTYPMWIAEEKRVVDQICTANSNDRVSFELLAKFYPLSVNDLIQDITVHLFFLQIKGQILSQVIFAPAEKCVLLASYALHAKYGDYDQTLHKTGKLSQEQLIPDQLMKKYQLTREGWEENVIAWYSEHTGHTKEWAEMQYLIVSQDLDMFGVNYFLIQNKKGTDLWLGIDAGGLQVFEKNDRIKAKIYFPWSEVKNISFQDKKFTIKPVNDKTDDFKFYTKKVRTNRMILHLCLGNHDLYMRKHREDTLVVQALKQQAKEEKKRKQIERDKLIKERRAKEIAMREREELEVRLRKFEGQARKANDKLQKSEEATEILEDKVRMAEEQANLLAKQAAVAHSEIISLKKESAKNTEILRKQLSDAEELSKQLAITAETSAQEAYKLRRELDSARHEERIAKQKLLEITQNHIILPPELSGDLELQREINNARLEELIKSEKVKSQLNTLKSKMEALKVDGVDIPKEDEKEDKYQTLKRITAGETKSRIAFFHSL